VLVRIDNITGSNHDDVLEGNAGANILRGGNGADTVTYEHFVQGISVTLATTDVQDTIGAGKDRLFSIENLTGTELDDVLTGSTLANVLNGLGGGDVIGGGAGDDTIDGGSGADILTGGAGADTFVFSHPWDGVDTITDFVSQYDALKVVAADFGGGLEAGAMPTLISTSDGMAGPDGGGYFIFDNTSEAAAGVLYWDASGGGDEDAIALARLVGTTTLLSSDFLIV
jgi:Ca2+-binding RTX toxin-like protein